MVNPFCKNSLFGIWTWTGDRSWPQRLLFGRRGARALPFLRWRSGCSSILFCLVEQIAVEGALKRVECSLILFCWLSQLVVGGWCWFIFLMPGEKDCHLDSCLEEWTTNIHHQIWANIPYCTYWNIRGGTQWIDTLPEDGWKTMQFGSGDLFRFRNSCQVLNKQKKHLYTSWFYPSSRTIPILTSQKTQLLSPLLLFFAWWAGLSIGHLCLICQDLSSKRWKLIIFGDIHGNPYLGSKGKCRYLCESSLVVCFSNVSPYALYNPCILGA